MVTARKKVPCVIRSLHSLNAHCLDCLARALKHRRDGVATVLNELRRTFRLREQAGVCGPCGEVKMVYDIGDAPFATAKGDS